MDADLACTQRYDSTDNRRGSKNSCGTRSTKDSSDSVSSLTSSVNSARTDGDTKPNRQPVPVICVICDSLPQQDVGIFRFSLCHIDFSEAPAGKLWKLKCRISGKTVWKSDEQKTERCAGGRPPRKTFHGNATPKIVCEPGDAIEFELCSPSLFGSKAVAKCALPMSEALLLRHQILNLGFASVHDMSGKIVANLQVDFKVSCAPLGSIGTSSSKENPVPEIPTFRNDLRAVCGAKKNTEYDNVIVEAEHLRNCLQSAVDLHRSLQLRDRPQPNSVIAL